MKHLHSLCLCLASLLPMLPASLQAQTDLLSQLGDPTSTSVYPFPQDYVNLQNGNFHIEIPIETFKERNGATLTVKLVYDSLFWTLYSDGESYEWGAAYNSSNPLGNVNPGLGVGWKYIVSPSASGGNLAFNHTVTTCQYSDPLFGNTAPQDTWTRWQYIDNLGTAHLFDTSNTTRGGAAPCLDAPTYSGAADDGSGYFLSLTNYTDATVYDVHGNIVYSSYIDPNNYQNDATRWVDTNGNIISHNIFQTTSLTDELGRTITLPANFSVQEGTIQVGTTFGDTSITQYSGSLGVLTGITLPDSRHYSFTYDGGGTGHSGVMTSMTLPTGGTISFQTHMSGGSTYGFVPLTQLSTPDGASTFNYGTDPTATITAPTDPQTKMASQTTYTYSCPQGMKPCSSVLSIYPGTATGTPLRSIAKQFDVNGRPTSVTTTLANGKSQTTTYSYADVAIPGKPGLTYPGPLVGSKKEYDLSGSLVRETDVNYEQSVDYVNRYINDLPMTVAVYGAGGAGSPPIAQTNYSYDQTALSTGSGFKNGSVLGAASHDDGNYGSGMIFRGNLTGVSRMTAGSFLQAQTNYYNILGTLVKSSDSNNNFTQYDYSDSWANNTSCVSQATFAYPTATLNAVGQNAAVVFNACDGSIHSLQDQNDLNAKRPGTVYAYDGLERLTSASFADGGLNTINYGGSNVPETITTTTLATPESSQVSSVTLDGLGRVANHTGADGNIAETTYDPLGRVYSVSNPHGSGSSPTDGTTVSSYDALGEKTSQTNADGTAEHWCYNGIGPSPYCSANKSSANSGTWVDFTDENGHHWQRVSDGLGRLVAVLEPDPSSGADTLETDYQYDGLDNLTHVDQWGGPRGSTGERSRSFLYDGLSRLLSENNPETSTVAYTYDNNGNVQTRTDARGVVTTYNYDALNRLLSKTYSNDPANTSAVSYAYDNPLQGWNFVNQTSPSWTGVAQTNLIGRLSYESNSSSTIVYGYDALGRTTLKSVCTPSTCGHDHYDMHVGYDLAGNIKFADRGLDAALNATTPNAGHYFGGMNYTIGSAGRVTDVTADVVNAGHPQKLLSGIQYSPLGGMTHTNASNNIYNFWQSFTPRGQLAGSRGIDSSPYGLRELDYHYDATGNLVAMDDTLGLYGSTYHYDALNRLTSLSLAGNDLSYSYDPWGNATGVQVTAGQASQGTRPVTVQNRLTSANALYDAAGNITNDGLHTYSYDAENHLISVSNSGIAYQYGPEGNRVAKSVDGTLSEEYLYDPSGSLVTTLDGSGNLLNATLAIGSFHFADYEGSTSSGSTLFRLENQVNSLLTTWDQTGEAITSCVSEPFGGDLNCAPSVDYTQTHFTDKKRDSDSQLDYFGARDYQSRLGRFISPDFNELDSYASPVPYADFTNPQSLNLYSYAENNPLTNIDPDGHDCVVQSRTSETAESYSVSSGNCNNVTIGDGQTKTYVAGTVDSITAGADGKSIDIGYTAYGANSGNSSSVTNASAAPIPDNTNLAYYYGNNSQGYQTFSAAYQAAGTLNGVATFYGISALGAISALGLPALPETGQELVAFLEARGYPATQAAAKVTELLSKPGMQPGKIAIAKFLGQRLYNEFKHYQQQHTK